MNKSKEQWLILVKRLALPTVVGVATIFGVHHYLSARMQAMDEQAQQGMVSRVVSHSAMVAGTVLSFEDLSVRDMPRAWVSADSIEPEQAEVLEGMVLLQDVVAGQPLTRSIVSSPKPPALSEQLSPGRRAVTIPVDHVSSLSGRLEPGDSIDVYVTFAHEGQRVTTMLVTSVRVLATDRPMITQGVGLRDATVTSVTLDVSAKQAVKLVSANQGGVLSAVLRLDRHKDQALATNRQADNQDKANHLAGFVGLAPSLGENLAPSIIYGDAGGLEQ
jgi:pilus assembly protein CpaB